MNPLNMPISKAQSFLENLSLSGKDSSLKNSEAGTAELVGKDSYNLITAAKNITSYSKLSNLHACPRKYQLTQFDAIDAQERTPNVDFSFGHAVGAGFQELFATGNIDKAIWQCLLAWDADLLTEPAPRKKKCYPLASLAVQQAQGFLETSELSDYEIATLPSGRPAVEVSFAIDCENGFIHRGHIDLIAKNKYTGKVAVLEVKTSGFKGINPALYYNSDQATSYSVVVDALFPGTNEFEIYYIVYSVPDETWGVLPVNKPTSIKAEFLSTLLLDHAAIKTYEKLDFYPKRGSNCYSFSRECKYLMQCSSVLKKELPSMTMDDPELDFKTSVTELRLGMQSSVNVNMNLDEEQS
jgi:hypothetical protein